MKEEPCIESIRKHKKEKKIMKIKKMGWIKAPEG
jgi:hypothetical protein